MKAVTIQLPDAVYRDLELEARSLEIPCYTPRLWAADLIAAELASRRLARLNDAQRNPSGEIA